MKKLLFSLVISLSLLTPVSALANGITNYQFVAKVNNVYYENQVYYTSLIDNLGEQWIIETDKNLNNKWLLVTANDNGTDYLYDDNLTGIELIEIN